MKPVGKWILRHVDFVAFLAVVITIGLFQRGQVAGVDQRARDQAARINVALCSFSKDLDQRADALGKSIEMSEAYLKEHPEGIPSLGFTAAQLRLNIKQQRDSLTNQRRTLAALSSLQCPKPT